MSALSEIVGKVKDSGGKILCGSHGESHELYCMVKKFTYLYNYFHFGSVLSIPYSPHSENFVGDFMTMFYKNLGHFSAVENLNDYAIGDWCSNDKYSFKCISNIARYGGNGHNVHKVCDFIRMVKTMGDKYVCAPAINLYADAVLAQIYEAYKVHRGNLVYPSNWKPRRR